MDYADLLEAWDVFVISEVNCAKSPSRVGSGQAQAQGQRTPDVRVELLLGLPRYRSQKLRGKQVVRSALSVAV